MLELLKAACTDMLTPARPHLNRLPNSTSNQELNSQMLKIMRDISFKQQQPLNLNRSTKSSMEDPKESVHSSLPSGGHPPQVCSQRVGSHCQNPTVYNECRDLQPRQLLAVYKWHYVAMAGFDGGSPGGVFVQLL